ncbi:MAG: anhydro-N-acetylmuramic acid kinase [Gemmatimonadales bacterium]
MNPQSTLAVGLMSGTSLDGVDAALVRVSGPAEIELVGYACRPYAPAEREEILAATVGSTTPDLARLHVHLAEWAAQAVEVVLAEAGVQSAQLSFIAFPGQTLWHEPPLVSWQLGEPAVLAERFGVRVVSGFRARDVAAGGQGAPLVPMADVLAFGAEAEPRVLLNLGGMANLTYVERRGRLDSAFAFDTGPGMAVIDAMARQADPTLPYDRDGYLASQGVPDEAVLRQLLEEPFFAAVPPKSTGRERFGIAYARSLYARVPGPAGVATAVELTARSVAQAIARWVPGTPEVVASGGGIHHPVLMRAIERHLGLLRGTSIRIRRFDELFFNGDAKEAVAFALLGYLVLAGHPGNLPAATGARGFRLLGSVTPA